MHKNAKTLNVTRMLFLHANIPELIYLYAIYTRFGILTVCKLYQVAQSYLYDNIRSRRTEIKMFSAGLQDTVNAFTLKKFKFYWNKNLITFSQKFSQNLSIYKNEKNSTRIEKGKFHIKNTLYFLGMIFH